MANSLFSTSGSATIHIISPMLKSNFCRVFLAETASLFIGSVIQFYNFPGLLLFLQFSISLKFALTFNDLLNLSHSPLGIMFHVIPEIWISLASSNLL